MFTYKTVREATGSKRDSLLWRFCKCHVFKTEPRNPAGIGRWVSEIFIPNNYFPKASSFALWEQAWSASWKPYLTIRQCAERLLAYPEAIDTRGMIGKPSPHVASQQFPGCAIARRQTSGNAAVNHKKRASRQPVFKTRRESLRNEHIIGHVRQHCHGYSPCDIGTEA